MIATLEDSARALLDTALMGGDWVEALEPMMTAMNALGGGPSRVVPPHLFTIPTRGVQGLFEDFQAGSRPPLTASIVIPATAREGFVADHTSPMYAARLQDPFYNEFLRPRRACHQAVAFLDGADASAIRLLVYREEKQGPFAPDELDEFSRILPYLRSSAMLSRTAIHAMARRQAEPFERRGEPVLFLGPDGRLRETNAAGAAIAHEFLHIVRGRLVAAWPSDQVRLDRALTAALVHARPALVTIHAAVDDTPIMALALPVSGDSRDVFLSTSAIVVLIDPKRRQSADDGAVDLLREAADLTGREAAVVRLVGMGRPPKDAATDIGMSYGTARTHLKSSFAKLGVHSQAELVALIHRLR